MAEPLQIFQPAYAFVDSKLDVFLNERAGSVMAQVSGPLRAALVLYVLLYGFAILRGTIQEPFMDFVVRSLKLAFVFIAHGLPSKWTMSFSSSSSVGRRSRFRWSELCPLKLPPWTGGSP